MAAIDQSWDPSLVPGLPPPRPPRPPLIPSAPANYNDSADADDYMRQLEILDRYQVNAMREQRYEDALRNREDEELSREMDRLTLEEANQLLNNNVDLLPPERRASALETLRKWLERVSSTVGEKGKSVLKGLLKVGFGAAVMSLFGPQVVLTLLRLIGNTEVPVLADLAILGEYGCNRGLNFIHNLIHGVESPHVIQSFATTGRINPDLQNTILEINRTLNSVGFRTSQYFKNDPLENPLSLIDAMIDEKAEEKNRLLEYYNRTAPGLELPEFTPIQKEELQRIEDEAKDLYAVRGKIAAELSTDSSRLSAADDTRNRRIMTKRKKGYQETVNVPISAEIPPEFHPLVMMSADAAQTAYKPERYRRKKDSHSILDTTRAPLPSFGEAVMYYYAPADAIVLGLSGTKSLADIVADAKAKGMVEISEIEGIPLPHKVKVAKGFVERFLHIAPQLYADYLALLDAHPTKRLIIAGHSMGGALATLTAVFFKMQYPQLDIRFAAWETPRSLSTDTAIELMNDPNLAEMFDKSFRTSNNFDPVPSVPFVGYDLSGFSHVGRNFYSDDAPFSVLDAHRLDPNVRRYIDYIVNGTSGKKRMHERSGWGIVPKDQKKGGKKERRSRFRTKKEAKKYMEYVRSFKKN